MRASCLLLGVWLLLPGSARGSQGDQEAFQAVIADVGQQRFVDAWNRSLGLTNSLQRAQAQVYVLYEGGDLGGALSVARAGLLEHPNDAYLLGQGAELCVSLGAGALGLPWAQALLTQAQELQDPEAEALARARVAALEGHIESERQRAGASLRARLIVIASVLASALAFALFGSRDCTPDA